MVLIVAYILVGLFVIGVFDLLVSLGDLILSGQFVDPFSVVGLIDTVLTLLIIVEIHRLLLAYIRQDPVIQIVINVGIIAIAREIISFRVAEYGGTSDALFGAAALAVLLLVLVLAFFVLYNTKGSDDIALPNWGETPFRDDIPDRYMGESSTATARSEPDGGERPGSGDTDGLSDHESGDDGADTSDDSGAER
jgi:Predicted membrane protein